MDRTDPANIFSFPFQYWVGMDTDPRTTPEALAEFNRFYSTTHVGEVIAAHPGFVAASRYERSDPNDDSPRWLAIYGMADEAAALQYLKDNERPWLHRKKYSPWPPARKKAKTVWRMLWRKLAASDAVPDKIVLVGTNTPATQENLAQFELYRGFVHPTPGAPRFYAVYEPATAPAEQNPEEVWRIPYRYIPAPP